MLTLCVYTWLILAILLARASHGISYPYLYLNSAASPIALCTEALASAMEPVMTQPTDGDNWNMCETDDGSMSLSCITQYISSALGMVVEWCGIISYRNLLLRQDNSTILSSHSNRHDICRCDSFECIFCIRINL